MNCESFRRNLSSGAEMGSDALVHMRTCGPCLERAVEADPENLFRSLGGEEMDPPGGVEPFVQSVMDGIQVRQTESRLAPRLRMPAWSRWAAAAALAVATIGTALLYQAPAPTTIVPVAALQKNQPAVATQGFARPVVEDYDNANATIIQLASADDLQVVMVFDDTLPADL
jgi:hypothetical protein